MDALRMIDICETGQDRGQGNLLGIQPFMDAADYRSAEAFEARLESLFQLAAQKGWIGPRSVIVLPEYLGTWLVVEGESRAVTSAGTISAAMRALVLRHLRAFLAELLRAREPDRVTASLFRVKARRMAQLYQATFARLARKYAATIVAGSILLPDPRVIQGTITPGRGPLYNASFVFHPDGGVDEQIARKCFPIADELPFVAAAAVADLPVFDTPAGRLGVMVCADSWFPEAYRRLRDLGAELIAVPSVSSHGEQWYQPWVGYSGWPNAADVDPGDIGSITERQAWGKYALAGRAGESGARAGINVFLFGDLWDLEFTGGRWRVVQGTASIEAQRDGAALVNLWL